MVGKNKKEETLDSRLESILKISKAVSSDLMLEDILKLIVTVIAEMLDSKICSLQLLNEAGTHLEIRATQSMIEEYNGKPPLKITEGIAGKVVREKKPIVVPDVLKDPEYKYKDIAAKEKLVSFLCVPLLVKGRVTGVINCYTTKFHKFTGAEIKTLMTIASQAAVSIENADLLVRTKVIQEELENRKLIEIAKDILMTDMNVTGSEAIRILQKYSMNSRKPIKEVAQALILSRDLKTVPKQ